MNNADVISSIVVSPKKHHIENQTRDVNHGRRSHIEPAKPLSAVHLTNISTFVPPISQEIHTIAQRSIMYDPISEHTLNALSYASPWAALASYSPRHAIRNTRSTMANVTDPPDTSKCLLSFLNRT